MVQLPSFKKFINFTPGKAVLSLALVWLNIEREKREREEGRGKGKINSGLCS